MLCSSCQRLMSALHTLKKCLRCQGQVVGSLPTICETCSNTNKLCAACLKKLPDPKTAALGNRKIGCNSCGRG